MRHARKLPNAGRRGSALVIALIALMVVAGMAGGVLALTAASKQEHLSAGGEMQALYVAEAGINVGILRVRSSDFTPIAPEAFADGGFQGTVVDNGDGTATVQAWGTSGGATRGLEAILQSSGEGIFSNALFAGNSSGDPNYDLGFGGKNAQADLVTGNVYSGGNVVIKHDASITGTIRAKGTVSGASGDVKEGVKQPIPDIAGMKYETNHDVDVAGEFKSAIYKSNSLGGKAWELPEKNPAHIFRLNPSDRTANTSKTAKNDYFLEDPYEKVNNSTKIDPSGGTRITLSGIGGKPGVSGNEKVYFVDGNLWIHNNAIFSFTLFNSGGEAQKVTFVVKGNIYFSDNVFYNKPKNDGIAFIAIKDDKEKDSGNIYFGDPTFGTLEHMEAFMYAENNFHDNNLSATGSAKVTVHGNMTAGNQVKINRDFGAQHSKLTVDFDDRIWTGTLDLPGLPNQSGASATWLVMSWREIAAP